nr:hypothetical protein [Tanacetum cinerariifolium]
MLKKFDKEDLDRLWSFGQGDLQHNRGKERICVYFNFPFAIKLATGLNVFQQDPSPHGRILLLFSLLNSFHQEGLQNFLQVKIFYDRIDHTIKQTVDYAARVRLRKLSAEKAWATIEELARYKDEGWNDLVDLGEGSLDYENPDIEQLLRFMECKVDTLMKEAILLMGRSESIFRMTSNTVYQLPSEPSRQEKFKNLVMNFILDQEEKVKQLEEYMGVIGSDFMQLSLKVVGELKEEIRMEKNRVKKIEKITRPNDEALKKCILSGLYKPTTILVHAVEATDNSPAVAEHTTVETPANMSPENKAYFLAEKESIHLILTGIRDDIYSIIDTCQTAHKMWEAIERLQQGQRLISSTTSAGLVKQYQNEVNELRAEKLARNANPLSLVATAQASQDPFYQSSRHKGKEIAKSITPPSETASEEDNDPEQAQRDKDMQNNLALIDKYFKKIYKPTINNLRTSSNFKNKHVDTTLRKPKRVKDFAYHKAKMLICKQAEQGVSLQAEQYDWLANTNEEVDEQELEAHYNYMAKIQENEQNDVESDDERVALANLIVNLKLDVDENKKIQKQLKKANTSLAQELKEYKTILAETSKSLRESISVRDNFLVALQTKQAEFKKYKAFNDRTVDYDKLERKLNDALGQLVTKTL